MGMGPQMPPALGSGMLAPPMLNQLIPSGPLGPGHCPGMGPPFPGMLGPPGPHMLGLGPGFGTAPGPCFAPPPLHPPLLQPHLSHPGPWSSVGPHGHPQPPFGMFAGPGRPDLTFAELALELAYVHLAQLASMRPEFRRLPLGATSVDGNGMRSVRIGRQHQPQWFEAVLVDAHDLAGFLEKLVSCPG